MNKSKSVSIGENKDIFHNLFLNIKNKIAVKKEEDVTI